MKEQAAQRIISEEGYLEQHGAGMADLGDPAIHRLPGLHDKHPSRLAAIRRQASADQTWQQRRNALRNEYAELAAQGAVRPPTRTERLLATAQGHPDNDSVKAARRLLDKMGVSWDPAKQDQSNMDEQEFLALISRPVFPLLNPGGSFAKDNHGEWWSLQWLPLDSVIQHAYLCGPGAAIPSVEEQEYAEQIKSGQNVQPGTATQNIVVYHGRVVLNDGATRLAGARLAGLDSFPVWVSLADPASPCRPATTLEAAIAADKIMQEASRPPVQETEQEDNNPGLSV
jgi:hypothetical protein